MTYLFETHLRFKPYNCNRFWISDHVPQFEYDAISDQDAITAYLDFINGYGYDVSKTARTRCEKYTVPGEHGEFRCYTARTLIADRSANYCGYQFCNVTVNIRKFSEIM